MTSPSPLRLAGRASPLVWWRMVTGTGIAAPDTPSTPGRTAAVPSHGRRWLLPVPLFLVAGVLLVNGRLLQPREQVLDDFDRPDGLVTNEFAHWNPLAPNAVRSPVSDVTSGSLFAHGGVGWTGRPDATAPTPGSTSATNSAVFRVVTHRADFRNCTVSLSLRVRRFVHTPLTPPRPRDGVTVFLRYQSEELLYAVTVSRRDGSVVIKKKVPGGDVNGGTYYTLAQDPTPPSPVGDWRRVRISIHDRPDGTVIIRLRQRGRQLVARDTGIGDTAPINSAGRIGLRGDNADFEFDDVTVSRA
jgi:hypothetical protein